MSEEMDKVWLDVGKNNFGIFDQERKLRINPESLAFFWRHSDECNKIKEEVVLHTNLMRIEKHYEKKYGTQNPLSFDLLEKNPAEFVERLIRAVEICTLKYALNKGGGLNLHDDSIIKGKTEFLWKMDTED